MLIIFKTGKLYSKSVKDLYLLNMCVIVQIIHMADVLGRIQSLIFSRMVYTGNTASKETRTKRKGRIGHHYIKKRA
ncbi:hypothetical protein GWI33_008655 [Rhynchophorus ferrugineus]|uniref:Uncharacterized protein n=1 Tax=Rhynchophorus ferrugineus TaxID=354439 RepID=A0A834IHY3_RHYFE|nr:hypothetical protein GWI33_008655 [Rhynchophorus ferrugineus]